MIVAVDEAGIEKIAVKVQFRSFRRFAGTGPLVHARDAATYNLHVGAHGLTVAKHHARACEAECVPAAVLVALRIDTANTRRFRIAAKMTNQGGGGLAHLLKQSSFPPLQEYASFGFLEAGLRAMSQAKPGTSEQAAKFRHRMGKGLNLADLMFMSEGAPPTPCGRVRMEFRNKQIGSWARHAGD